MIKALITVLMVLTLSTSLLSLEYHVDKDQNNQVKFISEAPVEEIVGITSKIDGYVLWEDEDMTSGSEFYFEVDLASLDTGIGLRNRHLRENYLETDKFPYATFGGKIIGVVDNDDGTKKITAEGTFNLHGVEKKLELDGLVTKTENGYKASSQFQIKLEDYNIERPQLMLLKIGEIIQLDVQFFVKEFKQ